MAKHRGRGKGSVYYDKDRGRWVASVTLPPDPVTRRRPRRKLTAETRQDAEKALRKLLDELEETGSVGRKDYTTGQAIADLMARPPATWKTASTFRVNRLHADRLTNALGHILLTRLTVGQVEDHLAAEGRRGVARSTLSDELSLLRLAVRRAQKKDLVTRNVAELADLPAGLKSRRSRSMTEAQADQLLASDLTPWWRAWLTTALMLGLRPGELGALRWVDISDGVLRTRHGLQETEDGLEVGDLKTDSSRRGMQMPAAVSAALAAWRKEQAAQQLRLGPHWHDLGLVFTTGDGHPANRQKINREFKAACKAAGIGRDWQPRECRHTFVSIMSEEGADIEEISDAVGHVNSHITKVVYRHQIADKISSVARVMDGRKKATS